MRKTNKSSPLVLNAGPIRYVTETRPPEPCSAKTIATVLLRDYKNLYDGKKFKGAGYLQSKAAATRSRELTDEESTKVIESIKRLRA